MSIFGIATGGWNFLACEVCEKFKTTIRKAKYTADKRRLYAKLNKHYAFQEDHRTHYRNVS